MNDPHVIDFVNHMRGWAEELRALKAELTAASNTWYSEISPVLPNDAGEPIEDGREAEGVSRLTGADVHSFMNEAIEFTTNLNDQVISKPCVRFLEVH